jgi:cytochrome c oxidase subunit 1/cytochrome c oxidase subunit I+III
MSGKMLGERLGFFNWLFVFLGLNVAFLPMHWTGFMGMPRRIYTYAPGLGWSGLNLTTSIGAFILAVGILLFLVNLVVSLMRGREAGPNPWDASTLEWTISSPPPPHNFTVIPVIASRHPLWEDRLDEGTGRSSIEEGLVLDIGKQTLATSVIDAEPDLILLMPEDDPWPFIVTLAMALGFTGLLLNWWWMAGAGAFLVLAGALAWTWPRRDIGQRAGVMR